MRTACLWLPFSPRAPSRPPNIVFILADDLGVNDLGAYGRVRATIAYTVPSDCSRPNKITWFWIGSPDSHRLLQRL